MQRKVEYERERGGKAQYEGERERRAGVEPDSATTKLAVKPAAAVPAAASRSATTNSPHSSNHGTFFSQRVAADVPPQGAVFPVVGVGVGAGGADAGAFGWVGVGVGAQRGAASTLSRLDLSNSPDRDSTLDPTSGVLQCMVQCVVHCVLQCVVQCVAQLRRIVTELGIPLAGPPPSHWMYRTTDSIPADDHGVATAPFLGEEGDGSRTSETRLPIENEVDALMTGIMAGGVGGGGGGGVTGGGRPRGVGQEEDDTMSRKSWESGASLPPPTNHFATFD